MNPLEKWADRHIERVLKELKEQYIELCLENIPTILEQTSFKVRSKKYSEACPCYVNEIPCHPEVSELNCFLCTCPDYQNWKAEGGCEIQCNMGEWYFNSNLVRRKIWDCSRCPVPHFPSYVEDYLQNNINKLKEISDNL